ncbi:MAG: hypothetical protein PHS48_00850 [Bacteroidales bacterium]|nr:hypothetical protein [Bacteroidales bacterium]
MPYRRLPNTDTARLKALKAVLTANRDPEIIDQPVGNETLVKIDSFLPQYESVILNFRSNKSMHLQKNKEYPYLLKKARLYISHFIQVLNMAIARGEVKSSVRSYYGLMNHEGRVPDLNAESEVLSWGKAVIEGEKERVKMGSSPMTNPSIAVVKVWYEKLEEAYYYKTTYQKSAARTLQIIVQRRSEADDLILRAWNEIETFYMDLPEGMMRDRAALWGVVYVYRPYERTRMNIPFPEEKKEQTPVEEASPEVCYVSEFLEGEPVVKFDH